MPNGTYGGVRGKETKIGRKNPSFPYLLDYARKQQSLLLKRDEPFTAEGV